jgi:hypothetical protein
MMFWVIAFSWAIWSGAKSKAAHVAALKQAEADYFGCLDELEASPIDTKLKIKALELGRKYYSLKNPSFHYVDLQTGEEGGGVNNRAGNEAQIQSDIQMRIGGQKESALK